MDDEASDSHAFRLQIVQQQGSLKNPGALFILSYCGGGVITRRSSSINRSSIVPKRLRIAASAFELGETLTIALPKTIKCFEKFRLRIAERLSKIVIAVLHLGTKHVIAFVETRLKICQIALRSAARPINGAPTAGKSKTGSATCLRPQIPLKGTEPSSDFAPFFTVSILAVPVSPSPSAADGAQKVPCIRP